MSDVTLFDDAPSIRTGLIAHHVIIAVDKGADANIDGAFVRFARVASIRGDGPRVDWSTSAGVPWHRHISGPDAVAVEAAVMAAFAALPRIGTKDVHL